MELFSGCGQLPKVLNTEGRGCVDADIKHSAAVDLTHKYVLDNFLGWITSRRCVIAVWLGTPCSSWSRARHDVNGGGPGSKDNVFGVPDVSHADQLRVACGNLTLEESVRII